MMNILRFEELKSWSSRKVLLFMVGGLLMILVLLGFNWYMGAKENEIIQEQNGLSEPIMNQSVFNETVEEYLTGVNLGIEAQEEAFITAAGKGKSLEGSLTLPTYPYYRTALNNELISKKQPLHSMRYGTHSSVFTAIFLTYLGSIIGIVYFLFAFADGLSKEFEERTMYLYFTQPVHRNRLFLIKYGLAVGHSAVAALLFTLAAYLISFFAFGSSGLDYPVIVFTERSMTFIPILQYMAQVFLLFFFVLMFCFALHFLFSTLFRKTTFSLIATIFVLFEGHFVSVSSVDFLQKAAHFNPLTYLNVGKIFIGYDFREYLQYSIENQEYYANWSLPRILHNPSIDLSHGLFSLGVGAIILLLIGGYCFKRNIRWEA